MNVIFLTLSSNVSMQIRGIYADLMRKFRDEGHDVYIVSPVERRTGINTNLEKKDGVSILHVRTLNIQKTNVIEKGIGTMLIEEQYKNAIKKYLKGISFDLILYSTPPITFSSVIKYLKRKCHAAISYLLLKDIFPQNAVDIGMFGKKSPFYLYFRLKEKQLYKGSDYIGCMSPANVNFVIGHNKFYPKERVEVAPNSIELPQKQAHHTEQSRKDIRAKYGLPLDKPIFIYGGNLGRPQGIPFLIDCLDSNSSREDCHFLVIGTGTESIRLKSWYETKNPKSVTVMESLPKSEYDELVSSCDVGLIFLDHRFTIPNYPSRLLPYLENKMPVLCATDPNTDIGSLAEENGYGYWCESNSVEAFTSILDRMIHSDRKTMGERGYSFLINNYLVEHTYQAIVKHIK